MSSFLVATRAIFAHPAPFGMAETAARAGRTLLRALDGEVAPVIVWASRPLMTSTLEHTPSRQPMKDISVQSAGHQPHLPDEGARVTR
ncbi:MAG TPA: M81 family metallopeptidase, partial [Methylomirabilota bacterium]|jgi:microcystin degradation protein MlrC